MRYISSIKTKEVFAKMVSIISFGTKNKHCPICNKIISKHDNIILQSQDFVIKNQQLNIGEVMNGMTAYHSSCLYENGLSRDKKKIKENSNKLRTSLKYMGKIVTKEECENFCESINEDDIKIIIKKWFELKK